MAHPWTKATKDSAAVRIAMTVCAAGRHEGVLYEVTRESGLDSDVPVIELSRTSGVIHSDLTVGVDVTRANALRANEALCSPGVKLHGAGFIVTPGRATELGLGTVPDLEKHIRLYRNGRDLTARPREAMVIDLFGLDADDIRQRFPAVYHHVLSEVKPDRDANNRASYRDNWWIFGEPRKDLRPALSGLSRYIATVETTKHRVFQFLDESILPDNMIVAIASDDAFHLGVLSSRLHGVWTMAQGGTLEDRPRYTKSQCFDPFPFPEASEGQKAGIRRLAEELDAHRKRVLAAHPHLTLTGLYNVLERVRAGALKPDLFMPAAPASLREMDGRKAIDAETVPPLSTEERRTFDDGLILILQELHDKLDAAVAEAYGWPADLSEDDILSRLVALNATRAKEEARGKVKWLRPEYQIPRFGSVKEKAQLEADLAGSAEGSGIAAGPKPAFPDDDVAQTMAVMAALAMAPAALNAPALALQFRQGRKVERKVADVLEAVHRMGYASREGGGYAMRRAA